MTTWLVSWGEPDAGQKCAPYCRLDAERRAAVAAGPMTREQVATLVAALLAALDRRRERRLISDAEWTEAAKLLSARTAGWLRDATDATAGDQLRMHGR
jgi:hypothetical protein